MKGPQVAPAELEALLQSHEKIADAAVIDVSNERLGEALKAFVVKFRGEKRCQPVGERCGGLCWYKSGLPQASCWRGGIY